MSTQNIKNYTLDSEFDFGKYRGKSLMNVFERHEDYVKWCLENVKDFHIDRQTLAQMRFDKPSFKLSAKASCKWQQQERVSAKKHTEHRSPFYDFKESKKDYSSMEFEN